MHPYRQPFYDPRSAPGYPQVPDQSFGFAYYAAQYTQNAYPPYGQLGPPPPHQQYLSFGPVDPHAGPLPPPFQRPQQPSPALLNSPQLAHPLPSRPSTATSTASQARTDSTTLTDGAPAREEQPRSPSPPTEDQLRAQRLWSTRVNMSTTDAAYLSQAQLDLASMTVDKLKAAIRGTNSRLSMHLRLSGKKNDLYNALVDQLNDEYNRPDKARFNMMRQVIATAKISGTAFTTPGGGGGGGARGTWVRTADYTSNYGASTSGATSGYGTPGYGSSAYGATPAYGVPARTGAGAAVSGNLPTPRFGGGAAAGGYGAPAAAGPSWANGRVDEIPIRFRPSPFFRVEKSLSPVVALAKATPGDRKTAACTITLSEAQRTLLTKSRESPANAQYQVRLYCTSDTNYNQLRAQANQFPAPVEFPATCEIKLNGVTLNANTKGIKKQPGTAPPVNLSPKTGPAVVLTAGAANRVEVIYINTEKTFYIVPYLVEYTPVEKVVSSVKAGKTKTKDEVIQSIIALNSDEDVEASSFGLSLKDPLSFLRIDIPIRSAHCDHIACFDAMTWFEVNEQTPQWQCPICSKTLKVDDMVVDGYLEDILKVCSSSVEAVTVEPDGTWRSDNNKFGTAKTRSVPASAVNSGRNTPALNGAPGSAGGDASDKGKGRALGGDELVLSDDDDSGSEDIPLAKRPRLMGSASGGGTPMSANGGGGAGASKRREVVDLTLSSDEDDDPPPAPRSGVAAAAAGGVGMARQLSDRKTAAEVQADIDDMNARMVRD
ncbi:E3 SUMO-protein ligase pli1 [Rhodotorula kratochvilovae]